MNNLEKMFDLEPEIFARKYLDYLSAVLARIETKEIATFTKTLRHARETGAKMFFIGNGGSAATASHFANDLAIGTRQHKKPFRVMSLTDNVAIITALGNDCGYESIFSHQLKAYARRGDVLVGISASGNSANLLAAFEYAETIEMKTVALTAFDGGKLKALANEGIHVPTDCGEYGPAEDAHMILDHLIGAYLIQYLTHE